MEVELVGTMGDYLARLMVGRLAGSWGTSMVV